MHCGWVESVVEAAAYQNTQGLHTANGGKQGTCVCVVRMWETAAIQTKKKTFIYPTVRQCTSTELSTVTTSHEKRFITPVSI